MESGSLPGIDREVDIRDRAEAGEGLAEAGDLKRREFGGFIPLGGARLPAKALIKTERFSSARLRVGPTCGASLGQER
jgi:hypothetical protein